VQNIAEFQTIGRIGKIDAGKKVIHISTAANRRAGDAWKSNAHWNRATLFGKLFTQPGKTATSDPARITERFRQPSYDAEGKAPFMADIVADGFAIIAFPGSVQCVVFTEIGPACVGWRLC
jgi:single-strand DNA-binding protein